MKKLLSALLALCLFLSACGSRLAESPAPSPVPSDAPVYTRRHEEFTDTLIPADDYGPLIPFAGAVPVGNGEEGEPDRHLYGLMTLSGEVVTDPVFTSAFYLEEIGDWDLVLSYPNVMLLGKLFPDEEGRTEERYALCAGDGSWCTDFLYTYGWEEYQYLSFAGGIPQMDREKRLVFLDPDTGEERRVLDLVSRMDEDDYDISSFSLDPETGWIAVNLYRWPEGGEYVNVPLLVDPQNEIHSLPPEVRWVGSCKEGLVNVQIDSDEGTLTSYRRGYLDVNTGEWAIAPIYLKTGEFEHGVASVGSENVGCLINTAGEVVADVGAEAYFHGEYWYVVGELEFELSAVLDRELNPVDSPLVGCGGEYIRYLEDGWVRGEVEYQEVLFKGPEVIHFPSLTDFPFSLGEPVAVKGDKVLLIKYIQKGEEESGIVTLADLKGNIIACWEDHAKADFSIDRLTGEGYVTVYPQEKTDVGYDLYDLDGRLIAADAENGALWGGKVYTVDDGFTTLTDREGNIIFRWPVHSAWD